MNNSKEPHDTSQEDALQTLNRRKAKAIVAQVLEQREHGQLITDSELLSANPDIQDELREELKLGAQIRQALLCARRIDPPSEPVQLLTDSEIDQPIITGSSVDGLPDATANIRPRIPGYVILDDVSRGGQAAVYRAIQECTGRTVAVKVMSGGEFIGSRHRTRFEREATILASLDHPNIVSIMDRGRTSDRSFYLAMPYVEGVALDEYWHCHLTLDAEGTRNIVRLFSKLAIAVDAAHANGVIHRDLKPSNIRIDKSGEPHVLDFGLASVNREGVHFAADTITASGQIIGSVPWASPEQAAGRVEEIDVPSDIYSLGVILYQSLTDEFPTSQKGPIDQVLYRIRTAKAVPPSEKKSVRTDVDRKLDAIVLHCLEKSPEARYESARQLATDLDAWLLGIPVLARRRRPLVQWIFILTAFVFICSFAAAIPSLSKPRKSAPPVFELPHFQNSLGMCLVRIPPGSFIFGSPDAEPGRDPLERQQVVSIEHPFFIGNTDVTQAQYQEIMHSNPSDTRWRGPDFPVDKVSAIDAMEFCQHLSRIENRHYRLPTEIEWEYACRANSHGPFSDSADPMQTGWFLENSRGSIQQVAKKLPNAWGLCDMHGEVGQLCSDVQSSNMMMHIVKGGSAVLPLAQCRSASRREVLQTAQRSDVGFRVVCDP